jgi:hypothetical protein
MNAQELIDTARTLVAVDKGQLLLGVDNLPLENDLFVADLRARLQRAFGTAEPKRFLAAKRVVAQTEQGLGVAARTGRAEQEAI